MSKRRKGALKEGLATVGLITSTLLNPLGGPAHKVHDAEYGYGRNVGSYSRDERRNRQGNAVRNGTNDRNNRRRGNNQRFDYDPW